VIVERVIFGTRYMEIPLRPAGDGVSARRLHDDFSPRRSPIGEADHRIVSVCESECPD
jgi:hypothetical protein